MHQIYITVTKWSTLSQETGSLAHFERFFNYTLLHPDKLHTPIFCQIKHLMLWHGRYIHFQSFLCSNFCPLSLELKNNYKRVMNSPQYIHWSSNALSMLFPARNHHPKIAGFSRFREIVTLFETINDPPRLKVKPCITCSLLFCHQRFRCDGNFTIDQ